MDRKYTAQEMRKMAELIKGLLCCRKAVYMLLQAADDMEREETREKKYEYSVKEFGGYVQPLHEDSVSLSFLDGRVMGDENYVIVRRSVGEWEDVK